MKANLHPVPASYIPMQIATVVALASKDKSFSIWVRGETVPIVMGNEKDKCFRQVWRKCGVDV